MNQNITVDLTTPGKFNCFTVHLQKLFAHLKGLKNSWWQFKNTFHSQGTNKIFLARAFKKDTWLGKSKSTWLPNLPEWKTRLFPYVLSRKRSCLKFKYRLHLCAIVIIFWGDYLTFGGASLSGNYQNLLEVKSQFTCQIFVQLCRHVASLWYNTDYINYSGNFRTNP